MVTPLVNDLMSYYFTFTIVSIGFILLSSSLPLGFALRKRQKGKSKRLPTLSTTDFVPIICCVFAGLIVGQLVDFVLFKQMRLIDNEAVTDGLSHAIMLTVAAWSFYWYKIRE